MLLPLPLPLLSGEDMQNFDIPSPPSSVSWSRGMCIGRGSFASVSLARSRPDCQLFAVKSVDLNASLPVQVQSLEREIQILRSLSSPYVVRFLGDDVTDESPTTSYRNLHVEYLPGGTVADVKVDERTLRCRTWCIVSALRYVHSKGIVHCDVKGRNVLVTDDLNFAKLADFGSAIIGSRGDTRRNSSIPRGSPLWMAPEVIRGESQGMESDIWSLGCTVIEMVTGKPAWDESRVDVLRRIGYSEELPEFPAQLSEMGRDLVEKCLRRDPGNRWNCDQLLKHPFLAGASPNTIVESSPRCVLDNSEFGEEEDDEIDEEECVGRRGEVSGKERLRKIGTSRWEAWDSEGWMWVRGREEEEGRSRSGEKTESENSRGGGYGAEGGGKTSRRRIEPRVFHSVFLISCIISILVVVVIILIFQLYLLNCPSPSVKFLEISLISWLIV